MYPLESVRGKESPCSFLATLLDATGCQRSLARRLGLQLLKKAKSIIAGQGRVRDILRGPAAGRKGEQCTYTTEILFSISDVDPDPYRTALWEIRI